MFLTTPFNVSQTGNLTETQEQSENNFAEKDQIAKVTIPQHGLQLVVVSDY